MKSHAKPTRPPRSSRPTKETTGHLMKIISTISNSQDSADRDREVEKLGRNFNDSDKKLARLVKEHQEDLMLTMQAFSKVNQKMKSSQEKCRDMEEKLLKCKALLHCRRDELKRLWLEVFEHNKVLHMLKEIENLLGVMEKLEAFLKDDKYFEATKLLVESVQLLEGSLEGTDALKDLKNELYLKREELHNLLMKELLKLLYLSPSDRVLKGMKYLSVNHGSSLRSSDQVIDGPESISSSSLNIVASYWDTASCLDGNPFETKQDIESSIANLVECIALLNCVSETIEILKERCQLELMNIVRRSAKHVSDLSQNLPYASQHSYLGISHIKEQQCLLHSLLDLIFLQFKCVINNHKTLLKNLNQHKSKSEDFSSYEILDIWSKIQAVLEIFVGDYVDIHNSAASQAPAPSPYAKIPSAADISSFFQRKPNQRPKNFALFKFDSSSHALSMKTYLQEQKGATHEKSDMESDMESQVFVCPPANKNIMSMFKPLSNFIREMHEDLLSESTTDCPLYMFLNSCVKVFLDRIVIEVNNVIENASKSLRIWKTECNIEELKKVGASTHILSSALYIDINILELRELIGALAPYTNEVLQVVGNMLFSYKQSCQAAYSALTQPHSEDKRVVSCSWARDSDIKRLLRSLPNWANLQQQECSDFEESPEEVRLRNKPESEILITNLSGDTMISQHEMISDLQNLRNLALLHESCAWLKDRIHSFINSLPNQQRRSGQIANDQPQDDDLGDVDSAPGGTTQSLINIAKDFGDISDTCLLVLHLEVRVHCFHYLQPLTTQGGYAPRVDSQEPDPEILKLNAELSKLDESLQPVLKPCNIKYVFEGLGELISTILINSTSKVKRINENGIKKMIRNIFALQQNLTGITMFREVALDRARQYFDLLNHTPEEILNIIVESGPQFQEQEYSAAFHLLQRSYPSCDVASLKTYLERLHQILNEVAVSV